MRDVELILRAFALAADEGNYEKPMKNFLNRFADKGNRLSDRERDDLKDSFLHATETIVRAFGPRPFHIRNGVNAAVCDSVMVAFMRHGTPRSDVREQYNRLISNQAYLDDVSAGTTDADTVHNRIRLAANFLFGRE